MPAAGSALNAAGRLEGLQELALRSGEDVVRLRKAVRDRAVALGFSLVDQTKIVTAASELGRNTIQHGGGGRGEVASVSDAMRHGIRLEFIDEGPGIADIAQALVDGFSTGGGLGLGLSGAKRLSSEFEIESAPGKGTRVMILRWKGK
jgi:serine/threonine-protein kinase RsbT